MRKTEKDDTTVIRNVGNNLQLDTAYCRSGLEHSDSDYINRKALYVSQCVLFDDI
jgi:hypothetical protein